MIDAKTEFQKIVERSRAAKPLTNQEKFPKWYIHWLKKREERKQQLLVKMLERQAKEKEKQAGEECSKSIKQQ